MLSLMNNLTDKPDWSSKILGNEIAAEWREDVLPIPLLRTRAWDWCLAELQDKAKLFEKTDGSRS